MGYGKNFNSYMTYYFFFSMLLAFVVSIGF